MDAFRLALLLVALVSGELLAQDPPKPEPKKPDPLVKENIKKLDDLVRQGGKQDSAAVGVIQELVDSARGGVEPDQKLVARALEKLSLASERIPLGHAQPSTAHLFIVNPLSGRSLMNLFSTHPPIEERVRRLRSMIA